MKLQEIQKEELTRYQFLPVDENDPKAEDRNLLQSKLQKAMLLGNLFRNKCVMILKTTAGYLRVETTVWDATLHFISLKGGIIVPVRALIELRLV